MDDENPKPGPSNWRDRCNQNRTRSINPWQATRLNTVRNIHFQQRQQGHIPMRQNYGPETQRNQGFHHRSNEPFRRNMNVRGNIDMRRQNNERYKFIGFKTLEEIARADQTDILQKINERREAFINIVDSPIDKHDVFVLIVEILSKVSLCPFVELKSKLILDVCNSNFISNLEVFLMHLPYVENKRGNDVYWNNQNGFWENFALFCSDIVKTSPSTALRKCGPLIESISTMCLEGLNKKHAFVLSQDCALKLDESRNELSDFRNKYQAQLDGKKNTMDCLVGQDLQPPENFRELSVVPTQNDLMDSTPFLRPNIVAGSYNDVEHYLDVQFRLLREDCFGPIRDGINQYLRDPNKKKYDHVRIFHGVKFICPYVANLKMGVIVQIDMKNKRHFQKINWNHNKRFLYGSMVMFTKDNCKTIRTATILDRDLNLLSSGKLPISFIDTNIDNDIYNDDTYTMIESEVYFEPYIQVLKALQEPSFPIHLAMQQYIVKVDASTKYPEYLSANQDFVIKDVKLQDEDKDEEFEIIEDDDKEISFKVLQPETWPTKEELNFNESQYQAYHLALTHEFAVIQGPPGTGKTFIGIHVAKALLQNVEAKNSGLMLIICYTNHALDQFLEAISKMTKSIVRIGGQSRNKAMEVFNISNLRRNHLFPSVVSSHKFFIDQKVILSRAIDDLQEALTMLDTLNNGVISYKYVQGDIPALPLLDAYYKNMQIPMSDPLNYWLFETNLDYYTSFENCLLEYDGVIYSEEDTDRKRREIILDDENTSDKASIKRNFASFSLHDTKIAIQKLIISYKANKNSKDKHHLKLEIQDLHSRILLYNDMMTNRYRTINLFINSRTNFSAITLANRWCLYYMWVRNKINKVNEEVTHLEAAIPPLIAAYDEARIIMDVQILKKRATQVIGMTTSGAARMRKLLQAIGPKIVIVEEAAEVLEQHIITALTRDCQHLILIGDHQQLRPSAAHIKLAKQYGIEVSLFERMITNGIHSRRLNVQHRMRPEIAALISPHIYSDLANHPSVERFDNVLGIEKNLYFFTHHYREEEFSDNNSRSNYKEADMTLALANYLIQQGYTADDITILAAYSGQLFYMKKERPKYISLSQVKITVVDNYQGEESKIILLSLVRNNSDNRIGFLGTENRICVALSRAKEGFYIFGNIEMLKEKSELWRKIAVTLENNGSLGNTLTVKCQNHPEQITTLSCHEDFNNLPPEGGCFEKCSYQYDCGHFCQLYCHGYDREHLQIKCSLACERIICDLGHVCPLMCREDCGPCTVKVLKTLPCGHEMDVDCHREPDDPKNQCFTVIEVTLPNCGHKAKKCCYLDVAKVQCQEPCVFRLEECGHVCRRKCHVTDDPDHEKYNCYQDCARAKNGCTAELIGDRGDHQCRKQCFEKCADCHVQVKKKRSSCKHTELTACCKEVDETLCKKKCSRIMTCGHYCKKQCYELCGDCTQMVTKIIPDCNHQVKIQCQETASRSLCTKKCPRKLPCGHQCKEKCRAICDEMLCTELTSLEVKSPCGHMVKLPCNVFTSFNKGMIKSKQLVQYCSAPCQQQLACSHVCGGSCAACRQGRLHAPCTQHCQQDNICGHQCQEPCNQICPPCKIPCEVKCPHSRCKRLCCEPCVPCQEKCSRKCVHGACTRRCGEPCDRAPCSEPCPAPLACGHACRGLCGEPCPACCKLCSPDHYPTDFIGDEYEDDDKLIVLQDCGHIFGVEDIDNYMKFGKQDTITIRTCPKCRKPIINTNRYKDLVNSMFKDNINPIKIRVYGTKEKIQEKIMELRSKMVEFVTKNKTVLEDYKELNHGVIVFRNLILSQKKISILHADMQIIYLNLYEMIVECWQKYQSKGNTHLTLKEELQKHINILLNILQIDTKSKIPIKLSEQQQKDISNEIKRLNAIVQFSELLVVAKSSNDSKVMKLIESTKEDVFSLSIFDEDKALESLKGLQEVIKSSGIVSKYERQLIVKAINLKAGHWYKCPSGHFYCIGECGGAMQVGKCPDCGAAIGGTSHTLISDNAHAPEMDGSNFAAWSERNNMMNFNF